jgi:hypothetical protein
VPGADDLAFLNDAFAEWKTKVGAQIFDREHSIVPAKHGDL